MSNISNLSNNNEVEKREEFKEWYELLPKININYNLKKDFNALKGLSIVFISLLASVFFKNMFTDVVFTALMGVGVYVIYNRDRKLFNAKVSFFERLRMKFKLNKLRYIKYNEPSKLIDNLFTKEIQKKEIQEEIYSFMMYSIRNEKDAEKKHFLFQLKQNWLTAIEEKDLIEMKKTVMYFFDELDVSGEYIKLVLQDENLNKVKMNKVEGEKKLELVKDKEKNNYLEMC